MEIIKTTLMMACDKSIAHVILLCICLSFLHGANILLGTIIGTKESKFDIKKFLFGIIKAVSLLLIIVGVCYILNVFTLTISLIEGITIDDELVTTLELLGILVIQGIDISKEVIEKIKAFRKLKYVSYDDVVISDTNIVEPIDFKG